MVRTHSILESVEEALSELREKGVALKATYDGGEVGRRARANCVGVIWATEGRNGEVRARVRSSGGQDSYDVTVTWVGSRVRTTCTCHDHGRAGECKHSLAVAKRWLENVARPEWKRLTTVKQALTA
jgi:uncharacterized Zn finger protein